VYAYENFFGEKVSALRREEMAKLRRNGLNRATMTATMSFIPVLSAVLTFIVYGLTGHSLDAATIFSALQYFNILKQPISMLPMIFTSVTDMMVALGRIGVMLRASLKTPFSSDPAVEKLTLSSQAEELKHQLKIDPSAELAINMQGEFQYDSVTPPDQSRPMVFGGPRGRGRPPRDRGKGKKKQPPPPKKEEGIPFSLRGVNLKIPRGESRQVVLG
jgi:ATP-binding cassette subfamily C (CFTR/MRP) protein 1